MLSLLTDRLIQCMSDTYTKFATNHRNATEKCLHLFSYKAHAMGANTVSTIELTDQSHSSSNVLSSSSNVLSSSSNVLSSSSNVLPSSVSATQATVAAPFNTEGDAAAENKSNTRTSGPLSWHLMITSGGDDQAICVCNATLRLQNQKVYATFCFLSVSYLICT